MFQIANSLQAWRNDHNLQNLLLDDDLCIIGAKASRYSQDEIAQLLYARIVKFQEHVIDTFTVYMDAVSKKEDEITIKKLQHATIESLTEYERLLIILGDIITPEVKNLLKNSFAALMSQDQCMKIFKYRSGPSLIELSIEFLRNPRQIVAVLSSLMLVGVIADIYRHNNQDVLIHEDFIEYVKVCLAMVGSCMTSLYFMINSRKMTITYDQVFIPSITELLQKISLQEKGLASEPLI